MIRPPTKEVWILVIGLSVLIGGVGSQRYYHVHDPVHDVTVNSPNHDFGKVRQGQTLTHTFHLKNGGEVPIRFTKVESSCGCTSTEDRTDRIVDAGLACDLPVSIKTGPGDGPEFGRISVHHRSATDPAASVRIVEVQVKTDVIPDYRVRPTLIDFGTVDHLEPVTRTVRLRPEAMTDVAIVKAIGLHPALSARQVPSPPGERDLLVDVTFSGRALWKSGPIEALASIETNSVGRPIREILTRTRFVAPVEVEPASIVVRSEPIGPVEREIRIDGAWPVRIVALRSPDPAISLIEVGPRQGRTHLIKVTIAGDDPRRAINSEIAIDLALKSETAANEARTVTIPIHRLATE